MSYYSTNVEGINDASFNWNVSNAEHLIAYIYSNKDEQPYNNPEIRIGLVIKILIKSNQNYSSDILQPVVDDLENLVNDTDYLNSFDDPISKKEALSKELSLINKYMELDETISLNTLHYLPVRGVLN